ncbi:hypothetical protein PRIPAC_90130 [Pristionchus pacificus]|uniref:Uncharacterized protein n=1 Tax=Pristionchus pacificus TaxID=54126 RepID=A0A2A6CXH9_PRIPA|nr:hypothetical protein PRIPAC_90130 [Pristionchus pacificus]|eukprot:PDM82869.1 hypothetical protein PRIPAC_37262 [Pristionchus pacificus]
MILGILDSQNLGFPEPPIPGLKRCGMSGIKKIWESTKNQIANPSRKKALGPTVTSVPMYAKVVPAALQVTTICTVPVPPSASNLRFEAHNLLVAHREVELKYEPTSLHFALSPTRVATAHVSVSTSHPMAFVEATVTKL